MTVHRATLAWSAILAAAAGAALARSRSLRWGATDDELAAVLPGDELIAHPDLVATRAISIDATADRVWPWLAQLGQGRGGLYSYDALENLVGCDMHSADRIVPEWQHVQVGSQVRLHPDITLLVAHLEPGRAIVLRGGVPMGEAAPPYDFTWAFVLRDAPPGSTRLLVRESYGYSRWWAPLLVEPVELVSFVMSQRMLRGIRDRVERAAA
ncbi:MAG TPA: SRPBCC family protein [Actinomycetes bacterium]